MIVSELGHDDDFAMDNVKFSYANLLLSSKRLKRHCLTSRKIIRLEPSEVNGEYVENRNSL